MLIFSGRRLAIALFENRHLAEENGPHTSPYLSFYGRLYGGHMCAQEWLVVETDLLLAYPGAPTEMVTQAYLDAASPEAVVLVDAAMGGRGQSSRSLTGLYELLAQVIGQCDRS